MRGRHHRHLLLVLVGAVALLAVACGDDGSSGSTAADTPDAAIPEGDPALDQACADTRIFIELRDFVNDPPDDPAEIESRLAELTAEVEAGATAPGEASESGETGAELNQIAIFLPGYELAWETMDYDPVELETSGLGEAVAGPLLERAEAWAALAEEACAEDFPAGCAELDLSAPQCRCVGETRTAALFHGPELAGSLDVDDVAADCPAWIGNDWCESTGAVVDLEDFVLGDFGDVAAMGDEIRSGDFSSQEQAIAQARADWEEFVAASPPPIAAIGEDISSFLDDWEAVWADADYAYARILFEDDLSDAYLEVREDDAAFVNPMAALTAMREILCDQTRLDFIDNCVAENGTVGTCRCVYRSVGDGVYRDGIPQLPDGNIDVDALIPGCTT